MSGQNHFFHYVLIVSFAAGVVALGVNDIHQRYGTGAEGSGLASGPNLVSRTAERSPAARGEQTARGKSAKGEQDVSSQLHQPSIMERFTRPRKQQPSSTERGGSPTTERASPKFPFFGNQNSPLTDRASSREEIRRADRAELESLIDEVVE